MNDKSTNQLTDIARNAVGLQSASEYLLSKHDLLPDILILGRHKRGREVINRIKMPSLPRLQSNVEERKRLEENSSLFRRMKVKFMRLNERIADYINAAVDAGRSNSFFTYLYEVDNPREGEWIDDSPITRAELNQLYTQS